MVKSAFGIESAFDDCIVQHRLQALRQFRRARGRIPHLIKHFRKTAKVVDRSRALAGCDRCHWFIMVRRNHHNGIRSCRQPTGQPGKKVSGSGVGNHNGR